MSTQLKRSLDDACLEGLEKWRTLHPENQHWNNNDVAQWLIDNEGYGLEKRIARKEIAKRLAKAQNRKKVRNARGDLVHVYHSATLPVRVPSGKMIQMQMWGDRLTMSASFAHASIKQRHKQTEGMARAMSKDANDVNANNPNLKGNEIQLELDFNYVKSQKKPQRVDTIPIDQPEIDTARIIKDRKPNISAARRSIGEKT